MTMTNNIGLTICILLVNKDMSMGTSNNLLVSKHVIYIYNINICKKDEKKGKLHDYDKSIDEYVILNGRMNNIIFKTQTLLLWSKCMSPDSSYHSMKEGLNFI